MEYAREENIPIIFEDIFKYVSLMIGEDLNV
jgi:hypothetical protein